VLTNLARPGETEPARAPARSSLKCSGWALLRAAAVYPTSLVAEDDLLSCTRVVAPQLGLLQDAGAGDGVQRCDQVVGAVSRDEYI
jgi:hypothetical protein